MFADMAEPTHDPRVDAYIAAARPFARPILERLRAMVHAADPHAVETIKWSMPFFVHRGRTLCHMAGFKQHAAFGFWRGSGVVEDGIAGAMGQFGRLTSLADLPDEAAFTALAMEAVARAEAGPAAAPRAVKPPRPPAETPPELTAHFAADAVARTMWEGFPPGRRREYAEWIEEAKRPETRAKRVAQACGWIGEGKRRNWQHERR